MSGNLIIEILRARDTFPVLWMYFSLFCKEPTLSCGSVPSFCVCSALKIDLTVAPFHYSLDKDSALTHKMYIMQIQNRFPYSKSHQNKGCCSVMKFSRVTALFQLLQKGLNFTEEESSASVNEADFLSQLCKLLHIFSPLAISFSLFHSTTLNSNLALNNCPHHNANVNTPNDADTGYSVQWLQLKTQPLVHRASEACGFYFFTVSPQIENSTAYRVLNNQECCLVYSLAIKKKYIYFKVENVLHFAGQI